MLKSILLFLFLTLADGVTTAIGINLGLSELNPIISHLLAESGWIGLFWAKAVTTAFLLYALWRYRKSNPEKCLKVLSAINIILAVIVIFNVINITYKFLYL